MANRKLPFDLMTSSKLAVLSNPRWDFIHDLVSKIADLPEAGDDGDAPKKPRKKKEPVVDENGVVVKKAAASRATEPKKSRKKKVEVESAEETIEETQMDVPADSEVGAEVDVSFTAASSSVPSAPAILDEDDFDA